ncbi:hypothetical protein [Pseudomonas sp. TMP25]|uniref:hypothetical protein n=1 Tax=Pseudomonas sp. TMP25 TaxID=3136561 RepID=UPI00310126CB
MKPSRFACWGSTQYRLTATPRGFAQAPDAARGICRHAAPFVHPATAATRLYEAFLPFWHFDALHRPTRLVLERRYPRRSNRSPAGC